MVRACLDRKASTATGYAWLVWELDREIPPVDVGSAVQKVT
jgi:hypothetical protein